MGRSSTPLDFLPWTVLQSHLTQAAASTSPFYLPFLFIIFFSWLQVPLGFHAPASPEQSTAGIPCAMLAAGSCSAGGRQLTC